MEQQILLSVGVDELSEMIKNACREVLAEVEPKNESGAWVDFGLDGVCRLLGCSKSTALRVRNNPLYSEAFTQLSGGRKLRIDCRKLLDLVRQYGK